MEGLSTTTSVAKQLEGWRAPDDTVGPAMYVQRDLPVRKPEGAALAKDRELLSQMRAQEIAVARELAKGRDPEEYWQRLCDALNERISASQALEEEGSEVIMDRAVIQKIRWEMNALVPRLAEARVRRDARSFSDPKAYAERLERQYAQAERMTALAEGDEIAMRSAIDNARLVRAQADALRRLTANPETWIALRKASIHAAERSVLEDLPSASVETDRWRVELAELQAERAKLGFWNVFRKMELDARIAPLLRREAYEGKKKAASVARPR